MSHNSPGTSVHGNAPDIRPMTIMAKLNRSHAPRCRWKARRLRRSQASRAASREAEKELILKVLTRTRWNRRRAAQELQISYKALLYKLKQIGYRDYEAS